MSDTTRRAFLRNASITAAVAGAAVAVPVVAGTDLAPLEKGIAHDGPFTVWVKDVRRGEISVLVGESEIVHVDKVLATRLAHIAGRA